MSKNIITPEDDLAWASDVLNGLVTTLGEMPAWHGAGSALHGLLAPVALRAARLLFGDPDGPPRAFPPFGTLRMPYVQMGAVDSVDILNLDEMLLFAFYWRNRHLYRRVADLGANIGWHSLLLSRCGYQVRAWEPDPETYQVLERTLRDNGCAEAEPIRRAVSHHAGTARFVRVLGNRTSSHIEGAKAAPYGELERFEVELDAYAPIAAWADLIKMDIEGHEADLLCATDADAWAATDVLAEIGTPENAQKIYGHLTGLGVSIFSQKLGWRRAETVEDVPTHYSQGSVFLSRREQMPW